MSQLNLFTTSSDLTVTEIDAGEIELVTENKAEVLLLKTKDTSIIIAGEAPELILINPDASAELNKLNQNSGAFEDKESLLHLTGNFNNKKNPYFKNKQELQADTKYSNEQKNKADKIKIDAPTQKEPQPVQTENSGKVVFNDGKIQVKVKNETDALVIESAEKIKKETQKKGRKSLREIEAEADLIEVPEDKVLFEKQYYPISEVAKWFKVNNSLLRFWENEFDILKPKKNRKGDRLFRPEDVKSLQLIYQLLRQRKYTIEGAKEYIKTNRKKADTELELTLTLQRFKDFLLDLKANLQ